MKVASGSRSITRYPLFAVLGIVTLALSCSNAVNTAGSNLILAPEQVATGQVSAVDTGESVATPTTTRPRSEQASSTAGTGAPATNRISNTTTTTIRPPRNCTPSAPPDLRITHSDPAIAAIEFSKLIYPCAQEVGLAPAANPEAIATVAASDPDGPLLLVGNWFSGRLVSELRRLAPDRVVTSGFGPDIHRTLFDHQVKVLEVDPTATVDHDPANYDDLWLVGSTAPVVPIQMAAAKLGVGLLVLDSDSTSAPPMDAARDLIAAASSVTVISPLGEEVDWLLKVLEKGVEIPGGGIHMFPDTDPRRLVAFYGHPLTSRLGVLGEQDAERAVTRLKQVAEPYGADGARVLPTFEIIATVASASAGRDGDYSSETSRDVLRPWIETAAEHDVYVVLDLQPGRTDFLTQAKIYEEFLRLPHVGLALDPEWRLKPNQVHLTQIGTVDAAEINEVARWLAEIVREEVLPQKLFLLHQFRFSMITNRDRLETPDELAVVIQMDGQGSLGSKYTTWNVLTEGTEDQGFRWGWKNFYDEDSPTATPAQVLDLTPVPVFVSYQ